MATRNIRATDVRPPMGWVHVVSDELGPSTITPPEEGVYLVGHKVFRWAWVWFPNLVNHGTHLDWNGFTWTIRTWGHGPEEGELTWRLPDGREQLTEKRILTTIHMVWGDIIGWEA
jgi:hypothetical protein